MSTENCPSVRGGKYLPHFFTRFRKRKKKSWNFAEFFLYTKPLHTNSVVWDITVYFFSFHTSFTFSIKFYFINVSLSFLAVVLLCVWQTNQQFLQEFSRTGQPLTEYVTHTYDAVWAIALALSQVSTVGHDGGLPTWLPLAVGSRRMELQNCATVIATMIYTFHTGIWRGIARNYYWGRGCLWKRCSWPLGLCREYEKT